MWKHTQKSWSSAQACRVRGKAGVGLESRIPKSYLNLSSSFLYILFLQSCGSQAGAMLLPGYTLWQYLEMFLFVISGCMLAGGGLLLASTG